MWHTVLGELIAEETLYRDKRTNHEIRPFRKLIRLEHRDYTLKLQRIIVDFGVDESFTKAQRKLQEHYGLSISHTAIREITLAHALQAKQYEESAKKPASLSKDSQLLSETDGTLIPVIEHPARVEEEQSRPIDHRKNKQCVYKEAKLSMARLIKVGDIVVEKKAAPVKFEATTGDKNDSGERIKHCLKSLGANPDTPLHVVGDGALWIEDQYRQVTQGKSRYLIDFYHLMEYLRPAAQGYINRKNPDTDFNREENDRSKQLWLETAINKIKESQIHEVVGELKPYAEADHYKEKPIKDFITYVENRPQQFDYKSAIEASLPIGSGEIESANKSLIQQRIKIPGAWWKLENADHLIALRAMIANGHWGNYWEYYAVNMRLS
jgi:hypothetical protein